MGAHAHNVNIVAGLQDADMLLPGLQSVYVLVAYFQLTCTGAEFFVSVQERSLG